MLEKVKLALAITVDDFDSEIEDLINQYNLDKFYLSEDKKPVDKCKDELDAAQALAGQFPFAKNQRCDHAAFLGSGYHLVSDYAGQILQRQRSPKAHAP